MAVSIDMLLSRLERRLDRAGILAGEAIDPRYGDDLSGGGSLEPVAVFRPRHGADVAAILGVCNELGQPLVVQGGRTGLSGGARVGAGEAVLSLERMTALSPVETAAGTVVAEAGAPLQAVQEHAEAAGFLFGVDIGARGTATIGGNIATNAGGIRVLRYGSFRAQVLGVEAVLADGGVLSSLKGLAKDNSGYDLSQLFIGSEGTLGVVTRACLRLHPKPVTQAVAFCAMPSLDAAMALLKFLRGRLGALLSGFELIFDPLMSEMTRTLGLNAPVRLDAPAYVLADIQGVSPGTDEAVFAEALGQAMEDGLVTDAALSQSDREFRALWTLRDDCNRYLFALDSLLSLDVSLPLPRMGEFLSEAGAAQRRADPSARAYVFDPGSDGGCRESGRDHSRCERHPASLYYCTEDRIRATPACAPSASGVALFHRLDRCGPLASRLAAHPYQSMEACRGAESAFGLVRHRVRLVGCAIHPAIHRAIFARFGYFSWNGRSCV